MRDVSEAEAFLKCVAKAEAMRRAAATPQWPVNARLRIQGVGDRGSHEAETGANGQMPAQKLVDTRDSAGVIGANGDIMGIGEQSAGELDWGHVVRVLESANEDAVRDLLPKLTGFFVALTSGKLHLPLSTNVITGPCVESLLALLESEKCSALWQEPGALGSFLLNVHMAFRQPILRALQNGREERERWLVDMGSRLMAWVYPKVDRLCLQALLMACDALRDLFNATWAVKRFAVEEGNYLKFGLALFGLLESLAASLALEANNLLWSAADEYMTAMLAPPTQELRGPEAPRLMGPLEIALLDRGILEWALRQRRPGWHHKRTPKLESLLARIYQVAGRHEPGRQKFGTCQDAVAILLAEADSAATEALTSHAAKLHQAAAVSTEDPRVCDRDVASCLERLARLLTTLADLTSDVTSERAQARWREFCGTNGLALLKKVLEQRALFRSLGAEYLRPDGTGALKKALGCAERLWAIAAAEGGLKKCGSPVS